MQIMKGTLRMRCSFLASYLPTEENRYSYSPSKIFSNIGSIELHFKSSMSRRAWKEFTFRTT